MKKERFSYEHFDWLQWHIYDYGEFLIEVSGSKEDANFMCNFLNDMQKRNSEIDFICRKLRINLNDTTEELNNVKEQNIELENENDMLKLFLNKFVETFQLKMEDRNLEINERRMLKKIWNELNLSEFEGIEKTLW